MTVVEKRDHHTLIPMIEKYIEPGTVIISDEWASYNFFPSTKYEHVAICHKKGYVSRELPRGTQRVENMWRWAKYQFPETGTSERHFDSYLFESLWRQRFGKEAFENMISHIAEMFPPTRIGELFRVKQKLNSWQAALN